MKRTTRRIFFSCMTLLSSLGLTSCYERLYFPDYINSPGLSQPLEGSFSAAWKPQTISSDEPNYSIGSGYSRSLDAAFSPVAHIGLMGSYIQLNDRQMSENNSYLYSNKYGGLFNGQRWELGAGYYNLNKKYGTLIECYGGFGHGTITRTSRVPSFRDFDAEYLRYFIQPSIGYKSTRGIIVQFGIRLLAQQVVAISGPDSNIRYNVVLQNYNNSADVLQQPSWYAAPYLNVTVPLWVVLLTYQAGFSSPLGGPRVGSDAPWHMTLGLGFRLYRGFIKDQPFKRRPMLAVSAL